MVHYANLSPNFRHNIPLYTINIVKIDKESDLGKSENIFGGIFWE
jgi:hypothetical protein